jgi:hypothetical protein
MKFIILSIALLLSMADTKAQSAKKCDHIYVSVEQPEIKIEQPKWSGVDDLMPGWTKWPSGKQQGQELVCVRCFNKIKQVLDYGQAQRPAYLLSDGSLTYIGEGSVKVDTCRNISYGYQYMNENTTGCHSGSFGVADSIKLGHQKLKVPKKEN